jgi:hypothetical protein
MFYDVRGRLLLHKLSLNSKALAFNVEFYYVLAQANMVKIYALILREKNWYDAFMTKVERHTSFLASTLSRKWITC